MAGGLSWRSKLRGRSPLPPDFLQPLRPLLPPSLQGKRPGLCTKAGNWARWFLHILLFLLYLVPSVVASNSEFLFLFNYFYLFIIIFWLRWVFVAAWAFSS